MTDELMNDPFLGDHNPTVYGSRSEMESVESGEVPFSDGPDNGCWNCREYNGDFCTKYWNNLDEAYKVTWRDEKRPDEICDDWEHEPDAIWEDFFE